jgi:hypothetical protein
MPSITAGTCQLLFLAELTAHNSCLALKFTGFLAHRQYFFHILAVQVIEGKSMEAQLLNENIQGYDFQAAPPINSELLSTLVAHAEDEVLREMLSSKEELKQQIAGFGIHQDFMVEDPLGVLPQVSKQCYSVISNLPALIDLVLEDPLWVAGCCLRPE